MVVKGVVCKKNVAHRRMTSKIDKPRLLILGGALEYQRVTNHLSSFDTLLQQVLIQSYPFYIFLLYLKGPRVIEGDISLVACFWLLVEVAILFS